MSKLQFTHIIRLTLPAAYLASLFAMASCADDEIVSSDTGRVIRFEVTDDSAWSRSTADDGVSLSTIALKTKGPQLYLIPEVTPGIDNASACAKSSSRSEAITRENITDCGVYASTGSGADRYYMENVEVTKDNSWTPRKEYLWPGTGSLHINAYSPYCSAPDASEGITALPSADATAAPTLEYTVPAQVTRQTDLMWAAPRDASSSPCALKFNHALAAVRFVAGAELVPCTVKSVTIAGLLGKGTLNIENGAWTNASGSETYTATLNAALTSATDEEYVAEGTTITDASHTFMLLPQTLTDDATITIAIEYEGEEIEYSATLSGQAWSAGNTYTYHISATPTADHFVITVTSPLSFNYTGETGSYTVKSIHESTQNGVMTTEEVPWKAEFVDADGNVIATPSWITSMALEGEGSGNYTATTRMVEPTFIHISEPTRILREQPEVGSEASPYNLSNAQGASAVENTANCYVINAPGTYSIPLVYGNAIKDGADNTAAYAPTRSSAPFFNHLGKRIKHPYIYDNEGCETPSGAVLVWEGRLNMIHNLSLSADRKSLVFELPRAYIRQGNAVVGVTDASGEIMWSWQLWITDYVPGTDLSTMSYNGKDFEIMPYNMGNVDGGDEVDFATSTAMIRFTQIPADGSKGDSVTLTIEQKGKHIITPACYSFYQWGRKDPMISGIKEWYYADHTEITKIDTQTPTLTAGKVESDFEALCVKHPEVFWIVGSGTPTFGYTNNWNLGTTSRAVKTVYDPCPAGFMVPGNELMALRDIDSGNISYSTSGGTSTPAGFKVICSSGPDLFFPALGYRSGNSGNETVSDANGSSLTAMWTSHANTREASALILNYHNESINHPLRSDPRLDAFAVHPIRE